MQKKFKWTFQKRIALKGEHLLHYKFHR